MAVPAEGNGAAVVEADSVGVRATKDGQDGRLVVFRSGWADLENWSARDEPLMEVPGSGAPLDLPALEVRLERFGALLVLGT